MNNFYCQQKCGEVDFSIDEWNKAFQYCIDNNLSEKQTSEILEGKPCKKQCFDCMAIVGETRKKNRLKRESQAQNRA
jgi:hypothetical protein